MKQSLNEVNYLKSIELLGEQIRQSYQEAGKLKLPSSYSQVNKIVACGMGGSQLGVDLINSLFTPELKVPIIQVRDYAVPKFVDDKTLVFLISYSGTTEEVLTISLKLKTKNLKPIIITVGDKLGETAKKYHWPLYQFEPKNNPSGQPRMGTGYVIGSLLAILKKLKLVSLSEGQIRDLLKSREQKTKTCPLGLRQQGRRGKKQRVESKYSLESLTQKLKDKIVIIVAAEHLLGNAHIIANQINESSKQFACYFALPELNHHLLEGLTYPKSSRKNLYFLLFFSNNYYPRIQKRFAITQEVLTKQKIKYQQINLTGNKIAEAMELLILGSLLSYQLSKLNKVDPNKIPWVNYFKEQLGKPCTTG